ncbi:MAG: aminopeptidase P family protein, partial [Actinomycetota bacterium]|nr:aminopeptidase P family protein [Actinomycetota bacterium]
IYYLSGFTGSAGLLWVDSKKALLLVDGRYGEQAIEEVEKSGAQIEVEMVGSKQSERLQTIARETGTIGLEAQSVSWSKMKQLEKTLENSDLVFTEGLVEDLRQIKDKGEIALMKTAAEIADKALSEIWSMFEEGVTEKEIATSLDETMVKLGADGTAFETIIATGSNSARPHARPGDRVLSEGDLVVCDMGALYKGYRSDMTRSTRIGGTGTGKPAEMLEIVLEAQKAGLATVKEGIKNAEVDSACREVLKQAGMEEAFTHGTGHGVGLDIHEAPTLSGISTDTLRSGQVVTVEPGVYLPEIGGVRWEDTVIVNEDGCEFLTHSPKVI